MSEVEKPQSEKEYSKLDFSSDYDEVARELREFKKLTADEAETVKDGYQTEMNNLAVEAVKPIVSDVNDRSEKVWDLLSDEEEGNFKKDIENEVVIGPAIWHAKDGDRPVVITGILGWKDKQLYVSIEGSPTGILINELDYGGKDAVNNPAVTDGAVERGGGSLIDTTNLTPETSRPETSPILPYVEVQNDLPPSEPEGSSKLEKVKAWLGRLKDNSKKYASDKEYQQQVNKTALAISTQVGYRTAGTLFGVKFLGDLGLAIKGEGDIAEWGKSIKKKSAIKESIEDMLGEYIKKAPGEVGVYNNARHQEFKDRLRISHDKIATAEFLTPEDKKDYRGQLAKVLVDFRRGETNTVGKKIDKATDLFTHSKVTGFRIAGDALNTAFTFGGMPILRGAGYGLMMAVERASTAKKNFEKKQLKATAGEQMDVSKWKYILKDVTVTSVQETFRALQGKGKTADSKHKAIDFIQAAGSITRFAGLTWSAVAEIRTEGISDSIEKSLDALDKSYADNGILGSVEQAGKNFSSNAERMTQFYAHPIDSIEKVFSGGQSEVPPAKSSSSPEMPVNDKKSSFEMYLDHDNKPVTKQVFYDQLSETHSGDSVGADSLEKAMAVKAGVKPEDFVKNYDTIWAPENVQVGKGGSFWKTFTEQYKTNPEYFGYKADSGLTAEQYGNKLAVEYFKEHNLIDTNGKEVTSDVRIKSPDARVMWSMKDGELQMSRYTGGQDAVETYTHEYKVPEVQATNGEVGQSLKLEVPETDILDTPEVVTSIEPLPSPEISGSRSVADVLPNKELSALDKIVGAHEEYLQDENFINYLEQRVNPTTLDQVDANEVQRLYELGEQFKEDYKFGDIDYNLLEQYQEKGLRLGVINDGQGSKFILFDRTGQNQVSPLTGRHISVGIKAGESFNAETFNKYMKLANIEHVQELNMYNEIVKHFGQNNAEQIVKMECGPNIAKQLAHIKNGAELVDIYKQKFNIDLTRSGNSIGERIADKLSQGQSVETAALPEKKVTAMESDINRSKSAEVFDDLDNHVATFDMIHNPQAGFTDKMKAIESLNIEEGKAVKFNHNEGLALKDGKYWYKMGDSVVEFNESNASKIGKVFSEGEKSIEADSPPILVAHESSNKNIRDIIGQELTNTLLYAKNPGIKEILMEIHETPNVVGQLDVWEKTSPEKIQILWNLVDREVKAGNSDLKEIHDLLLPKAANQIEQQARVTLQRLDEEEIVNKAKELLKDK